MALAHGGNNKKNSIFEVKNKGACAGSITGWLQHNCTMIIGWFFPIDNNRLEAVKVLQRKRCGRRSWL